jgi:HSP20 family protein
MFARTFWDELNDFRRSFDQNFENFYNNAARRGNGADRPEVTFTPVIESGWTDDHLNMRVVLPAVSQKDLKLSVQGNQLVIRGERRAPEHFAKEGGLNQQLLYGRFERVLDLPNGLDLEKMQAQLHDGVLDIRVPVAQAMKPRQIQISTGSEAKSVTA